VKTVFFIFAWISFILGFIGIFLPVLPSTPFFILSAYLFSKSSPRFHAWLLGLPFAGPAIRDWGQHRVVRPRAKFLCAFTVSLSLFSLWRYAQVFFFLKVLITTFLLFITAYVVSRKSHE
jgi:uncharacterized protein